MTKFITVLAALFCVDAVFAAPEDNWIKYTAPSSGEALALVWTADYVTEEPVLTLTMEEDDYNNIILFDVTPAKAVGLFRIYLQEAGTHAALLATALVKAGEVVTAVSNDPIEPAPGKTAEETVQSLCTTGRVVIVDDARVSVVSNVVTLGSSVIILKPYYTAKIVENTLCVELNTNAVPVIAAGENGQGETVDPIAVGTDSVSVGCTSQIGLWYQLLAGEKPSVLDPKGDKQQGTGKALKFTDSEKPAPLRFYRIRVTDYK